MSNISGNNPPILNDVDYVDKIKNSLDAIDTHDHTTGKGAPLPAGSIAAGAIVNADISATAEIARAKLANGTADHVVINDGTGDLTSEAQLAGTRGGTGVSSTATFPTSGVVVTRTVTETLTNKTLSGNIATTLVSGAATNTFPTTTGTLLSTAAAVTIAQGGTGQATATAAFNALDPTTTAGDLIVHNGTDAVRLAVGSDGQTLIADASQTNKLKWATLPQGNKNYITYNNFENNAITGWGEVSATAGVIPTGTPTFSASSAASIAIASTATNPLAGSYSLQMVGAIAQGQGFCTDALTIDREDRAKVLQGSFYYEVVSGASNANWSGTSSNTLSVYIYDVTNSRWEQPQGVYNLVQSSGQGKCTFTYQTASNTASLRVIIWCANTASGSITVNFDDFVLGPQITAAGAAISDWEDWTPSTIAGLSGYTVSLAKKRRVGSNIELNLKLTLTGASNNIIRIPVPTGITFDATKWVNGGSAVLTNAGATTSYQAVLQNDAVNALLLVGDNNVGYWSNSTPRAMVNTDIISLNVSLPVVGWSSNSVMSADTDTRIIAFKGTNSAATSFTSGGTVKVATNSTTFDYSGSWSTDTFTVPVSGTYRIGARVSGSTVAGSANGYILLYAYKNGSIDTLISSRNYETTANVYRQVDGSTIIQCKAGDTLDLRINNQSGSTFSADGVAVENSIYVERLSGPATIAASETVAAKYTITGTPAASSSAPIDFSVKNFDTHGAVTTGASWKFTAPISGVYRVSASSSFTTGNPTVGLYKNGSLNVLLTGTAYTSGANIVGSTTISLIAGDYIDIRPNSSLTASGATSNWVSIERLGGVQ